MRSVRRSNSASASLKLIFAWRASSLASASALQASMLASDPLLHSSKLELGPSPVIDEAEGSIGIVPFFATTRSCLIANCPSADTEVLHRRASSKTASISCRVSPTEIRVCSPFIASLLH